MIGPLMMFDKSFLEMLSPDEVSELSLHFKFVGTPTLIGEIIADLKLKDKKRVPSEVVRTLSRKMEMAHGLQPANYRKLGLANLYAHEISMIGQVVVDAAAPNVHVTPDGQGTYYDSTPEQRLWARWASGEFETDDELTAATWRNGIDHIDLEGMTELWKPFASHSFSSVKNHADLIVAVNESFEDTSQVRQREMLEMLLVLLKASREEQLVTRTLMTSGAMGPLLNFAPYAISILRLFLVFVCGLAKGFIGRRPTNYLDLQYLYYAPFCMVFVSHDKFHRAMWPATAGRNSFLWGQDVKDDLIRRVAARKEAVGPPGGQNLGLGASSVIADMQRTYMRPEAKTDQPRRAHTFEELDPEIKKQFRDAIRFFDRKG